VLEPCAHRVTEVERQVLDHEEVIGRSTGVACESLVLEPCAGVSVPIVPWHIGRGSEARGEFRVTDAPAKGLWTLLVW
jgi:hypothetical protein